MDFSKSSLILLDVIGLEVFSYLFFFHFFFFSLFGSAVFPLRVLWFLVETGAKEIRDDCDEDGWRTFRLLLFSCGGGMWGEVFPTTGAGVWYGSVE